MSVGKVRNTPNVDGGPVIILANVVCPSDRNDCLRLGQSLRSDNLAGVHDFAIPATGARG